MKVRLKLPRMGMNMSEATIVEWLKQPGDRFEVGEFLYSFETEKATQEVEATAAGLLVEILAPAGSEVRVGGEVGIVEI